MPAHLRLPLPPFFGGSSIASETSESVPPSVIAGDGAVLCTVEFADGGGPFVPAGDARVDEIGDEAEVQAGDRVVVRFHLDGTPAEPELEIATELEVSGSGGNGMSESGSEPAPTADWRIGPHVVTFDDGTRVRYGCTPVGSGSAG